MTQNVTLPHIADEIVGKDGKPTILFHRFLSDMWQRAGAFVDFVAAARTASAAAASGGTEIVASGGLQFGGTLDSNIPIALYVIKTVVASLPTSANVGDWAYATNGRNSGEGAAAGTGCPVCWSGSAWRVPGVSTAVAA